ncbi:hydrolase [Lactobacillus paracasei]|uniref:hydrolase n=1 Tax=Lacticaseibacillus paracasei TaxID=1597 RepID=UPI000D376748|nr:hydrolase [Lacticaseibacillus paracasei]PTS57238.1 hydrolase [Lactobacillus sp. DS22_6]MBS6630253.1 hydrolase [Lacticaseibacillus paracasei]MBX4165256.1 hydrolase [Lacticaseibacillus paracasei]MCZ2751392.1 hydrolase [Lacticaseibacillus paracasei]MCZ2761987.1 hydrolase [Lacticaseibacillus paracasei]
MKKLLSTVLFSAVALSAVALSKPSHVSAATKNTETATVSAPASDKTEADVTYNGGATTVWTSPTAGQQVKRYVTTGEHVKFVNSKKVFAEIWYETEDHGWIPERYLSINTLQQLAPLTKKADAAAAPTQTTSPAEQAAQAATASANAQAASSAAAQSAAESAAAQSAAAESAASVQAAAESAANQQALQQAAEQAQQAQQAQQQQVQQQQVQQQQAQQAAAQQKQQQQAQQQAVSQPVAQTTQTSQPTQSATNKGTFKISFYDPAVLGSNMGYSGVAANLSVFPKGTVLRITMSNGQTLTRTVNDTGSFAAGNPNQLDVAMPSGQIPAAGILSATVEVLQ